jgi:hypothetical protein
LGINPTSLRAGGMQPIIGKLLTKAITLLQTSSQSEVYTQNYATPKSRKTQLWQFRDSHLGLGFRSKCHLDVGLVEKHKVYYKGEGDGFPQVRAVVSFVSPNCQWFVLTSKVLQLYMNHLVLVLCRSVWVVDTCHSS